MKTLTAAIPATLAAALALAGCAAQQRPATPPMDAVNARPPTVDTGQSRYQPANGSIGGAVSASPPDNPTGSQAYQSPDLDDTGTRTTARPPRRGTGSQRYQR